MEKTINNPNIEVQENEQLTQVEELYLEGEKNYRLLFGNPIRSETVELKFKKVTRKIHYFRAGDIFAVDLWDRNSYGTTKWSVYVIQAAYPGEIAIPIPQVSPAARVLLVAEGQKYARVAVRLLKEIENRTDPTRLPPARFLLTDFRMKASNAAQRKGYQLY